MVVCTSVTCGVCLEDGMLNVWSEVEPEGIATVRHRMDISLHDREGVVEISSLPADTTSGHH